MGRIGRWAIGAIVGVLITAPLGAAGQPAPQPDYHPSLGDLMTMAVQPRHAKLGLAGRARNWPYATYEASELTNAFGRIARTVPTYRNASMADMVAANIKDPLDALDLAIKARNGPGFDRAYAQVTAACNACHRSLDHPFVVIRAPTISTFPDQSFTPAR
jgi:hypothetical protein